MEFAILLPVAVLILFGLVDLTFLHRDYGHLQAAVREAARTSVDRTSYAEAEYAARRTFNGTLWSNGYSEERAQLAVRMVDERPYGDGTIEVVGTYRARLRLGLPFLPNEWVLRSEQRAATITFVEHR